MTSDRLLALQNEYLYPKTARSKTECCKGYYQKFGTRSTSRASGSLVTPPDQTSSHHHYHKDFNKSATQLFLNFQNRLSNEAKLTTTHLGQPFIHATMKLHSVREFFDVIDGSLITYGGYTNFIHCDQKDNYTTQESQGIKDLNKSQMDNSDSVDISMLTRILLEEPPQLPLKQHVVGALQTKTMIMPTYNSLSMLYCQYCHGHFIVCICR